MSDRSAWLEQWCPTCHAAPGARCGRWLWGRRGTRGRVVPIAHLHVARGWLERPCPTCKAPAGERCSAPTGREASRVHTARLRPARRELVWRPAVWEELERRGATVAVVPFWGRAGSGRRDDPARGCRGVREAGLDQLASGRNGGGVMLDPKTVVADLGVTMLLGLAGGGGAWMLRRRTTLSARNLYPPAAAGVLALAAAIGLRAWNVAVVLLPALCGGHTPTGCPTRLLRSRCSRSWTCTTPLNRPAAQSSTDWTSRRSRYWSRCCLRSRSPAEARILHLSWCRRASVWREVWSADLQSSLER